MAPESIVEEFKTALQSRKDELSELGKTYSSLRSGTKVADGNELDDIFLNSTKDANFKNLTKNDEAAVREAGEFFDRYSKGEVTDTDLLSLRHQLDSTIDWDKNVSQYGEAIVKKMRSRVDALAKDRIPGLAKVDTEFAPERQLLSKVSKDVLNPDGTLKDNAISTIMNLTGKGKELKIKRFLKVVPGLEDKIRAYKAFDDVRNAAATKVGQYVKGGLA